MKVLFCEFPSLEVILNFTGFTGAFTAHSNNYLR